MEMIFKKTDLSFEQDDGSTKSYGKVDTIDINGYEIYSIQSLFEILNLKKEYKEFLANKYRDSCYVIPIVVYGRGDENQFVMQGWFIDRYLVLSLLMSVYLNTDSDIASEINNLKCFHNLTTEQRVWLNENKKRKEKFFREQGGE